MTALFASVVQDVELPRQVPQAHRPQPLHQQSLGLGQCFIQRSIDHLLDCTCGVGSGISDGKQVRATDGVVNVQQRYRVEIAGKLPPSAVTFLGTDKTGLLQARHGPPHDNRVGTQHL